MLRLVLYLVYTAVCVGAISAYAVSGMPENSKKYGLISFFVMMLFTQMIPLADLLIRRKKIEVVSAVYIGLLIGVLLSYLLNLALKPVIQGRLFEDAVYVLTTLMLPYVCISLILQTKDDFRFVIPYVEFSREVVGGKPLIIDSSAMIDGRIADVVETKILDARFIVPDFILKEIQDIADSNDKNRRTRGRRGLDVLSRLQNSSCADVTMLESGSMDSPGKTVDQKLVILAKELGGRVVTNDYNLNKVASVQGVEVINLNNVANSLKPRFLPGDQLRVRVIKEGESPRQGVGYLDDGTMVVCEQASQLIGEEVDLVVSSVLQSSAGRMIFARQAEN